MKKNKVQIFSPTEGDKVSHLQPVVDFLIKRGNIPVTGTYTWDKKSGIGTFLFKYPVDVKALEKEFEFPKSIRASHDSTFGCGVIFDRQYAIKIHQAQ